jgi:hypothetical protein
LDGIASDISSNNAVISGAYIRLIPGALEFPSDQKTYIHLGDTFVNTYGNTSTIFLDVGNVDGNTKSIKVLAWNDGNTTAVDLFHIKIYSGGDELNNWRIKTRDRAIYADIILSDFLCTGTHTTLTANMEDGGSLVYSVAAEGDMRSGGVHTINLANYVLRKDSCDNENAALAIQTNSSQTFDGKALFLTFDGDEDGKKIDAGDGIALGNHYVVDGVSSYRASTNDNFFSPDVFIEGAGKICGKTASYKICASKVGDAAYVDVVAVQVSVGSLALMGRDQKHLTMDGPVEMKIFDGSFGAFNVSTFGTYTIAPCTLAESAIIEGHFLIDASRHVELGQNFSNGGHFSIDDFTISGEIQGQVGDAYAVCATVHPWNVSTGAANSSIGIITMGGTIKNHEENGDKNFVGVVLDAHSGILEQFSVGPVFIDATSPKISQENGNGAEIFAGGTMENDPIQVGVLVHAQQINSNNNIIMDSSNIHIRGKNAAIVLDGADGTKPIHVLCEGDAQFSAHGTAIVGRNLNLSVGGGLVFGGDGSLAIGPGETTLEYVDGATGISELKLFSENDLDDDENLEILRNARLRVTVSKSVNLDERAIAASSLAIPSGVSLTCGRVFVGNSLEANANSQVSAKDGIYFAPGENGGVLAFKAGSSLLDTPFIDASHSAVVADDQKEVKIEINSTVATSSTNGICFRGVVGNLPQGGAEGDVDQYVCLVLGGNGGTIGMEPINTMGLAENDLWGNEMDGDTILQNGDEVMDGISCVGRLIIDGKTADDTWTINGDTLCQVLEIKKGKLVQNGKLTILGNLLLLGCDIEWRSGDFGHIYVDEDRISVRRDCRATFSNGFFSTKGLDTNMLRREAILLGGDGCFALENGAGETVFHIAGCAPEKFRSPGEPVAIRVLENTLCLGELPDTTPQGGATAGRYNAIDLGESLEVRYYDLDGNPYAGTVTAIRANETTSLHLHRSPVDEILRICGQVSHVGQIFVHGRWCVDGLYQCGNLHLTSTGHLHCANAWIDVGQIHFYLSASEEDAHLSCGGFSHDVAYQLHCDESILTNGDEQTYLLIDGLQDVYVSLGQLVPLTRGTFEILGDEGGSIYLRFAADGTVSPEHPRQLSSGASSYPFGNGNVTKPIAWSMAQGRISRQQNDLLRQEMLHHGGDNGDDFRWHLLRSTILSHDQWTQRGGDPDSARTHHYGNAISLARSLAGQKSVALVVDYESSSTRFMGGENRINRCKVRSYGANLRGHWPLKNTHLSAVGGLHRNHYQGDRTAEGSGEKSEYKFHGHSILLGAAAHRHYLFHGWDLGPAVELAWDSLRQGTYVINHASMPRFGARFLQGTVGFRAERQLESFHFNGNLFWQRDLHRHCSRFDDYENGKFLPRDRGQFAVQLASPWRRLWEVELCYHATIQRHSHSQSIFFGNECRF